MDDLADAWPEVSCAPQTATPHQQPDASTLRLSRPPRQQPAGRQRDGQGRGGIGLGAQALTGSSCSHSETHRWQVTGHSISDFAISSASSPLRAETTPTWSVRPSPRFSERNTSYVFNVAVIVISCVLCPRRKPPGPTATTSDGRDGTAIGLRLGFRHRQELH